MEELEILLVTVLVLTVVTPVALFLSTVLTSPPPEATVSVLELHKSICVVYWTRSYTNLTLVPRTTVHLYSGTHGRLVIESPLTVYTYGCSTVTYSSDQTLITYSFPLRVVGDTTLWPGLRYRIRVRYDWSLRGIVVEVSRV